MSQARLVGESERDHRLVVGDAAVEVEAAQRLLERLRSRDRATAPSLP